MLYTAKVKNNNLKSITHIDDTCRAQTVRSDNTPFSLLLQEFYKITGCPVLLNTSLNLAGRPIAGFIEDALELYNTSDLDCLVIGNKIYEKNKVSIANK